MPSAPLERRGIYGVELTLTVDAPTPHRNGTPLEEGFTPRTDRGSLSASQMGTTSEPTPQPLIPAQPLAPAAETFDPDLPDGPMLAPPTHDAEPSQTGLPASLIALQRAADLERRKLELLEPFDERTQQRRIWREAAATVQNAVTHYARAERLNRSDVERQLRRAARNDGGTR